MAARILDGIRVVDWTVYQVGPFATAMLADLGAEVIHVEELEHGDLLRGNMTVAGVKMVSPAGRQINFEEHNRNKKGIAVNLKIPEGREAVYKLVAKSDIFVTNFRKAAVDKLQMDYRTLKSHNPLLIYARASGLGDKGPLAGKASLDAIGRARSGFSMAGGEVGARPIYASPGVGDRIVSLYLAFGILAALHARDKWGIGQEITTSQLGSMISIQGFSVMVTLFQETPREFPRLPGNTPNPAQNYYKCKDGRWIVVVFAEVEGSRWSEFWEAIGRPELAQEPKFATFQARTKNSKELLKLLDEVFVTKTQAEWEEIFQKTDVLVAGCKELAELQRDPQVLANYYITDWQHPVLGPIKFVGFPVDYSETPAELRLPAPELGQHTEEVLTQVCGYSWDEIIKLKEAGAIR